MSVYQTSSKEQREEALEAALGAVRGGELIVLPTDTVYGIGADAFAAPAVQALLDAKGRDRTSPPPVLVGDHAVLMALAVDLPDYVEDLADAFWPGPLTIVVKAQPSLTWDLGETRGTVALRMPDDEVALELLRRTGPLAVSSANRHGRPAATSVLDAATQLGDAVSVYLDAGTSRGGVSSTIIDATVQPAVILREGALSREQIVDAVGDIFSAPEPEKPEQADEAQESQPTQQLATADPAAADTASSAEATQPAALQTDTTPSSTGDAGEAETPLALPSEAEAGGNDAPPPTRETSAG